jgi:ABC-type antimicrobial peptide transport system permease subunit
MNPPWKPHVKAAIEIAFIIFLFYSNLLMGEFTASAGRGKSLAAALTDIFTIKTCSIALITSVFGHLAFDVLRKNPKAEVSN